MKSFPKIPLAALLYAPLFILMTWPLVLKINSHIFGGGDAYQFVWSLWWFGERIKAGQFFNLWDCNQVLYPFGADLLQHGYPIWINSLGLLFQQFGFTLLGSYNLAILFGYWMNAVSAFTLCYVVLTERKRFFPCFLAGLVFSLTPYFATRAFTGQFGLLHAYSLPFLVLSLHKLHQTSKARWGLMAGFCVVLGTLCSFYYGVQTSLYVVFHTLYRSFSLKTGLQKRKKTRFFTFFMGFGVFLLIIGVVIALSGGGKWEVLGQKVSLTHATNPMIGWWLSWLVAFFVRFRVKVKLSLRPDFHLQKTLHQLKWVALPLVLLIPYIVRAYGVVTSGDFAAQSMGWKTGPGGAYLLTAFLPSSYHPLWREWMLNSLSHLFRVEAAAIGLGLVSLFVVVKTGVWKQKRVWFAAFLFFLSLSLGPFMRIWPELDHGPVMPFWFVRFIPIASGARIPIRWIALALVFWSLLSAKGFAQIRAPRWLALCLGLILFEGCMAPVILNEVKTPVVYQRIGYDATPGSLLELPFRMNDGRRVLGGEYPVESMLYQIDHKRPVWGSYISRIPDRVFETYSQDPVLQEFLQRQQGKTPESPLRQSQFQQWVQGNQIAWIVLDLREAHPSLRIQLAQWLGMPTEMDSTYLAWRVSGKSG